MKLTRCPAEAYCDCKSDHPKCEMCQWYKAIDSGYGHCIAVPVPVIVPWCKVTCAHRTIGKRA